MQVMNNTVGRLRSLFPSHQLDVIIGSLLGDARLECRSIGVRSPITARFRVHHGFKQKRYVFWKYEVLKDLTLKEPRESSWVNPKRDLHEISWYFHTKSTEDLGFLHSLFYKDGVKIFPEEVFELLNPNVLAVWFMDDGSHNGTGLTINTHGFSMEEQLKIVEYLNENHKIHSHLVKDRSKFKIAIGMHDMDKFIDVIKPYVIPTMNYKIVYPRNDLSVKTGRVNSIEFTNTSVPDWKSGKGIV